MCGIAGILNGCSDLDAVHGLFADPEAMRFSLTGVRDREATREGLTRAIAAFEHRGHGFLAALLRIDGRYVGHAGLLTQEVDGHEVTEIAYWFLRRHWNRGLATEAAAACRDHGFDVLGRESLCSLIRPANLASRRVAEKLGMRCERRTVWKGVDVCVYRVDRVTED